MTKLREIIRKVIKEETSKTRLKESIKDFDLGYNVWTDNSKEIISALDLPPSFKVIDWPDLPKQIKTQILDYVKANKDKFSDSFLTDDERFKKRWSK